MVYYPNLVGLELYNVNGNLLVNESVNSYIRFNMQFTPSFSINLGTEYNLAEEISIYEWVNHNPEWHQVAVTYDGSKVSMYIDGNLVDSYNGTIPDMSDPNEFYEPLKIGVSSQTSHTLLFGNMDDIRFYNRALTSLEIQDMYTETNVQSFQGVLANDIDLDGDTLTATLVQTTTNGTLTLQDNGGFKYVPNANYSGNDNFIYKAFDGTYSSVNTTVSISV
ncbi:MAG TPA: LamG domain-containing protein, partial [Cytophagales bacterium]|nr:LamG domain-containing protein [Cytophagales bacterium]